MEMERLPDELHGSQPEHDELQLLGDKQLSRPPQCDRLRSACCQPEPHGRDADGKYVQSPRLKRALLRADESVQR